MDRLPKSLRNILKLLGVLVLLIVAAGVFDILRWEFKSFVAERERNKPKDQDFSFLGGQYHIPAGELSSLLSPVKKNVGGLDPTRDRSEINIPYFLGKIRIYDPTLQDARWSYVDISDKSDPYEIYGDAQYFNEYFQFFPRRSLNQDQIHGAFVSRNPLFAGQRIIVRCYYSGLVNSCMIQTYRPLNDTNIPLLVIEDQVKFRPPRYKPCTMREKEKRARKIANGKIVYKTCILHEEILNNLPSALSNIEQSMERWRENARRLSEEQAE